MEINEYLIKLFQTIKDMEDLNLFSDTSNLSRTEFRLLREVVLEEEKGKKIISSELARRLGITRSAVSQLVTKLEERGVVKRTASDTDRKIAYIVLSEHAIGIFEEECKKANAVMDRVTKEFGEKRLKALISEYDDFTTVFARVRKDLDAKNKDLAAKKKEKNR